MLLTHLREGTRVVDSHGDDVGAIERYVVDPADYRVTHVVLGRGVLLPYERLAPVDTLEETDRNDRLRLSHGVAASDLPPFEEHHYLDLGSDLPGDTETSTPFPAFAWVYPTPAHAGFPAFPVSEPPMAVETTRNVPDGSLVVDEGAEVLSRDGDSIGKVKEVGTNERDELAYVIVDPGWFKKERLVPGQWVVDIDAEGMHLSVSTEALRKHDRDRT